MAWTLDDSKLKISRGLTGSAENHLNEFMDRIRDQGIHPKEAADGWASNYKKLSGNDNQYQIKLSQSNRATFLVNEDNQTVTMLAAGGHT